MAINWHIDGTHKVRPKIVTLIGRGYQLYIIMSTLWQLQKAGLQAQYTEPWIPGSTTEQSNEGENLRMAFAMICSLAFVPPKDIVSAYLELVPTLPSALLVKPHHIDQYYRARLKRAS